MSGKRARALRKSQKESGEAPKPKRLLAPITVTIDGEERYYPRKLRRKMQRYMMTSIRKGRLDMAEVIRKKAENDKNSRKKDREGLPA